MSDVAGGRADASRALARDEVDDDQQLADERERLADERERLADEQEQLADERERLADDTERSVDLTAGGDESTDAALDQLQRAEARVRRAQAEQERARAKVERLSLREERADAARERARAADAARGLVGDEAKWAQERAHFVADERDSVAKLREAEADTRDDDMARREREADERDRATQRRERSDARRRGDASRATATLDRQTERSRRELAEVREAARRQRSAAARARRQAASDRAVATRRAAPGAGADGYGFLAAQFTALTHELFQSQDVFVVAERIADLSLECIPGAVATGVTLFEGVRPLGQITTDDIAKQLDAHQLARQEGPIAESLACGEPVSVADLSLDPRWPSFRAIATGLDVHGAGACGLSVRRGSGWSQLGALTVYAGAPDAFDEDLDDALFLFAAHLAVVAALDRDRHDVVRREAALHRALSSRDVIGQAKGILMERQGIPAGDAFDILRRTSQRLNIRLQELATRLAETGELPG